MKTTSIGKFYKTRSQKGGNFPSRTRNCKTTTNRKWSSWKGNKTSYSLLIIDWSQTNSRAPRWKSTSTGCKRKSNRITNRTLTFCNGSLTSVIGKLETWQRVIKHRKEIPGGENSDGEKIEGTRRSVRSMGEKDVQQWTQWPKPGQLGWEGPMFNFLRGRQIRCI